MFAYAVEERSCFKQRPSMRNVGPKDKYSRRHEDMRKLGKMRRHSQNEIVT